MFQALEYFESKRINRIYQNNKIVNDYLNSIQINLKTLNKTDRYIDQNKDKKQKIAQNKLSIPKRNNFEISKKNTFFEDNFNLKIEPDYFINNKIFSKIEETSKINNYFFPSLNNKNKFSNTIDEFYNKNFAIYIFKQIQSI